MRRRLFLALAALAASAGLVVGCGSDESGASSAEAAPPATVDAQPVAFEGGLVDPPQPAPALRLPDLEGRPVDLRDYWGKAVLVTFVYSNCPDVCSVLVSAIADARRQLGPQAASLQVLAVSLDPEGDTPASIRDFLARHHMTRTARYLVGERPALERTWAAWGVVAEANHSHPPGTPADHEHPEGTLATSEGTVGPIAHTSLTYGISSAGVLTTAYPAGFPASGIAHDIPLLASD